ncbi:MAG: nucleotide-binding protein, partial [Euryarchaeota archaeon CG_4_9_14_3_um_filter_38_12]
SFSERYRTISANGNPDDSIIELAEKEKGVVVTNDRILKKRLREKNIPVVYLRGKNHLEIEGRV